MSKPSESEIRSYLDRLSAQASFLNDPALIEAQHFIERFVGEDEHERHEHYEVTLAPEMTEGPVKVTRTH